MHFNYWPGLRAATLLCLSAGLALAPAGAEPPPTLEIRILEPLRAQGVVRTVSGYCGPNRFQVVLRMHERAPAARLEVDVNGEAIPAREREKVTSHLADGSYIMDASIAECERNEQTPKARVRLLIQEPSRGPASRFLEFWVSPSRLLTGIRFN